MPCRTMAKTCEVCEGTATTEHAGRDFCSECYEALYNHHCNRCNQIRLAVGDCQHCGDVEFRIRRAVNDGLELEM